MLTKLQRLSLRRSAVTGPIPTEIGQLVELQSLTLDSNHLTGRSVFFLRLPRSTNISPLLRVNQCMTYVDSWPFPFEQNSSLCV